MCATRRRTWCARWTCTSAGMGRQRLQSLQPYLLWTLQLQLQPRSLPQLHPPKNQVRRRRAILAGSLAGLLAVRSSWLCCSRICCLPMRQKKKKLEEVRRRAPPPGVRNQGNQRRGVPQQAYGEATIHNPTFDDSPAPASAEVDAESAYVPAVPGRAIVYDQGRLAGARNHALRDKWLSQQLANSHA